MYQSVTDATAQGFDPALEYAGDDATTNSNVESINLKAILNNKTLQMQQDILKELAKLFQVFGVQVPLSVKQLPGLQAEITSVDGTSVMS